MPVYKDQNRKTYYAAFYYTDFTGKKRKKMKRGFAKRRDALDWERHFLIEQSADLNMTFGDFVEIYRRDKRKRVRESTWLSKNAMIDSKILPYFKDRVISEIQPKDIIAWQNEVMSLKKTDGKPYASTYLKSVHSQLSAILNHAVRYYGLKKNAAEIVGNMGKESYCEMLFWTKEEYLKFIDVIMDKPLSFYVFEVLYWCGIREGEMQALTKKDFDFTKNTLTINKTYHRMHKEDVVTEPKTRKSNRVIQSPQFLADEIQEYFESIPKVKPTERIFPVTRSYLFREMERGSKAAGVKRIRIHDLRHSMYHC